MPAARTADPVHHARQGLLAKLESIEEIVTLTHEDLVVIALASTNQTDKADYLTLADAQPDAQPAPFEFTELDGPDAEMAKVASPCIVLTMPYIVPDALVGLTPTAD